MSESDFEKQAGDLREAFQLLTDAKTKISELYQYQMKSVSAAPKVVGAEDLIRKINRFLEKGAPIPPSSPTTGVKR